MDTSPAPMPAPEASFPPMPDASSCGVVYRGAKITFRNGKAGTAWRGFFITNDFPGISESQREILRQCGTKMHPTTQDKTQRAYMSMLCAIDARLASFKPAVPQGTVLL